MKSQHPDAEGAKVAQKTQKEEPVENDCSHAIIGAAVEVQRVLGVGLLESAYSAALAIELTERGIAFEREVPITGRYKGREVGLAYRADFIVDRTVIVELKVVDALTEIHRAQLLSYLRLAELKLGLLLNFNVPFLKDGIRRRIL